MAKSINKVNRRNSAFDKVSFILLAAGMMIAIIGFLLMSGGDSTKTTYNPDIFSVRRIKVVPMARFIGFMSMIYAIVRRPKDQYIEE